MILAVHLIMFMEIAKTKKLLRFHCYYDYDNNKDDNDNLMMMTMTTTTPVMMMTTTTNHS